MLTQFMARMRISPLVVDGIGGGLAVALLAVAGWFVYRPMLIEAATLQTQADDDQALLARADSIRADHAELQSQLADKQQLVKSLAERVPAVAQESEFFGEVARLSNEHSVRIHGFRPGPAENGTQYNTVNAEFDATAEYEPLCRFLHGLAQLPRLNHITSLKVSLPSRDSKVLTVKITTDIYFATPKPGSAS